MQWSSATPGYIIFLIDQSSSMNEEYEHGMSRAEFTAMAVNRTITELILANAAGNKIKDRVLVSLIGYGDSISELRSDFISKFAEDPLRIEKVKRKVYDNAGGIIDIEDEFRVYIDSYANGLTPMGTALEFAKKLIEASISEHPDWPAPVIINISDGVPFVGDEDEEPSKTIEMADRIMQISSNDGHPLIFNVHIGGDPSRKHRFEEFESELTTDEAKLLFKISSKVPESYKGEAIGRGFNIRNESHGFISNADATDLIEFINFGSSGAVADRIA